MFNEMLPTSLYVHLPWCIKKCPYCDFNSHKAPAHLPEMEYIQALIADLKRDLSLFPCSAPLQSIFFGGGTPSLFSEDAYGLLLSELSKLFTFKNDIEITLEANPGAIDYQRFKGYRQAGINRLSLGIQSFQAKQLKALGRIHDDKQAHQAILTAREAGFDNFNLDLMYGLPEQTVKDGLQDLKTGLAYQPTHLSWYQLTLEPNTLFYKYPPRLPTEDCYLHLEQQGLALLAEAGLKRYEISAFSQTGREALHNLNYWRFGDYYGIGAGAHGKLTLKIEDEAYQIYRTQKTRQPLAYLQEKKKPSKQKSETILNTLKKKKLDLPTTIFEFMLNLTRLEELVPYSLFTERSGQPLHHLQPMLKEAAKKGLLHLEEEGWRVTVLGRQYTNDLQLLFLA